MRLLFITPRASGGGAEKVITTLASEFAKENEVYLLTLLKDNKEERYALSERVHYLNLYEYMQQTDIEGPRSYEWDGFLAKLKKYLVSFIPKKALETRENKKYEARIEALKRLKKQIRPDCSISFLNSANYCNAMSKEKDKTIISIRSCLDPNGKYVFNEIRDKERISEITTSLNKADKVVSVSKEIVEYLVKGFHAERDKISVIYNMVNAEEILSQADKEVVEEDFLKKVKDSEFVFFNSGRLTEKKGQWHLLRAFSKVTEKHPKATLFILGREGKNEENTAELLKETINRNHLQNNVCLMGFRNDPYAYLRYADAYVMSSFNEGFPNALVEAMALSIPVISCDCSSGPREILEPSSDCMIKTEKVEYASYGILVPQCSADKNIERPLEQAEECLAEAMNELIENKELRKHYQEMSVKGIKAYNREHIIRQWKELID